MDDALEAIRQEADDDRRFEAISGLVRTDPVGVRGPASRLLLSSAADERRLGADLLGQVATVGPEAPDISQVLQEQLEVEPEARVRAAIVTAIGHTRYSGARELVRSFASDTDEGVRYSVAVALPILELDDAAVSTLLELTTDSDDDVRDWATFALAESDYDNEALREALMARTRDADDDTRAEAFYGLAKRRDARVRPLIERELQRPSVGSLVQRAWDELNS